MSASQGLSPGGGRRFVWSALALCGLYLALEGVYVTRLPLVMDEFQGGAVVEKLGVKLPYRDYRPYKTVLGHYALRLPMSLASDPWTRLLLGKGAIALATAGALLFASLRLARHYRPTAVTLALGLTVCMSTFLERSAALRVDMLTSIVGLLSLLALLERRAALAGALAALSFLVSQKGIYFALAGGAALGLHWLWVQRTRETFRRAATFGASALAVVALYFGFWALVASPEAVFRPTFEAPQRIALEPLYPIREFWFQTLFRNPYFWGVVALALGGLFAGRRRSGSGADRDWWLLGYGGAIVALGLWHKQPWPYFFVLLVPTGFVLAAHFFDSELRAQRFGRLALGTYLVLGIAVPLSRVPTVLQRDNSFQRETVRLASRLLGPDDLYLAGVNMIYTNPQFSGLSWLDSPRLRGLAALDPADMNELALRLEQAPPKLLVWNYRLAELPEPLQRVLQAGYAPLVGNLQVYSPSLPQGEGSIALRFGGRYVLGGPAGGAIELEGRPLRVNERADIAAGEYRVAAAQPGFRLHYLPIDEAELERIVDARFAAPAPLFENAYTY